MNNMQILKLSSIIAFFMILMQGCATTGPLFDQYAYAQTTGLKVDALAIMDSSVNEYSTQQNNLDAFNLKMEKAFEYEKHRPNNQITIKMWEIIRSPEKHLLGGFLARWKTNGKLGKAVVDESKGQIAEAFDYIVELESGKIKATDAGIKEFISKNE